MNGVGRLTMANGDYYLGEMVDDRRDGNGRGFANAEKELYEGSWSGNERSGNGYIMYSDGSAVHGTFRVSKLEGEGTTVKASEMSKYSVINSHKIEIIAQKAKKMAFEIAQSIVDKKSKFKF